MNELALFAGAGGGLLATKHLLGWRTVCYVERDAYCSEVLKARIRDGLLDDAPIWDDARTFDGRPWRGCVDIVTAGFPCQPFSVAGQQKAADDERNLWPDTVRILREVRPRWALLENVPGLLAGSHGYFGQILRDLAESGFDAGWKVLSAAEVGAPHRRDRLWIVAHAASQGSLPGAHTGGDSKTTGGGPRLQQSERSRSDVPHAICPGLEEQPCQPGDDGAERTPAKRGRNGRGWWGTEPDVGRLADGVANRVDRLRALGNGQVPAVAATAWRLLTNDQ